MLSELEPGSGGEISEVDTSTPEGRRLMDLGFVPGTRVSVVRRAPLRDPIEFRLRGTLFCLRRTEADRVRVRPIAALVQQ